ncbi:SIR2 family protein [Acinetobacter schindleri]|uniref:SIR2 family NAD-dependent protein deacylase n=1 Tax=Acinetobacter schindleri TaxID=108981 RepID=UPI0032B3B26E
MVGAGFSRNADPIGPSAKDFPLWSQVSKKLCEKLYPLSEPERLKQAISEASGTSGFLRLAQEYEIAFGRGSLHNFINDSIPDLDYQPSELHYQLLELPWKEVLTTNWDTLLERTQLEIPERSYNIVRTVDEIANTPSPRIIKLHGSVPSSIPLIFTEEDYRTYPKKFAPFVNTVQQIMMESVVVLLGFSGDDPNFLQWSGWVRDNLGSSAPKIYLAGWLNLSPHKRRMLENNNVVPIDLAQHPQASKWPEHLRHRYSTEWIIKTLQCGQSYTFKDWPSIRNYTPPSIPLYLEPLELNTQIIPLPIPSTTTNNVIPQEKIEEVVNIWEHNRKIYPNWIVFPVDRQYDLDNQYNEWINIILKHINDLNIKTQVKALREIFWFYQKKLIPLSPELEEIWDKLAKDYNFQNRTIKDNNFQKDWTVLRDIFIYNTSISLSYHRLNINTDKFNERLEQISNFYDYSIEIRNSIIYEKCLWFLINLDFRQLEEHLNIWNISSSDPIWMCRKAALLLELNYNNEAHTLILKAFTAIKKNPDRFNDFSNSSREGWTLLSIRTLDRKNENSNNLIKKFNIYERFKNLAINNCDANSQLQYLIEKTQKRPAKNINDENPHFDLYHSRGKTIHFNNYEYESMLQSYQCLFLCEQAGLPLDFKNISIGSPLIQAALENFDLLEADLVRRVIIRLKPTEDNKLLNKIYSRTAIAHLDFKKIENLINQVNTLLQYCLARNSKSSDRFWVSHIRTCLEILSRLIIRIINEDDAKFHLEQSINLFKDYNLRKDFWLHIPLSNYLKRSWEASNEKLKKIYIWHILKLPLNTISNRRPEQLIPISDLINNENLQKLIYRSEQNESEWKEIIYLITSGLKLSDKPRHDASIRLHIISSFLKYEEFSSINKLLWRDESNQKNELPQDTGLHDFSFILSPLGMNDKVNDIFIKKYFTESKDFTFLTNSLIEICNAFSHIKVSKNQKDILFNNINNWLEFIPEDRIKNDNITRAFNRTPSDILQVFSNLNELGNNVIFPKKLAKKIFEKIKYLQSYDIYTYHLVGDIVKSLPNKIDEISAFIRKGIISENLDNASNAMFGLYIWLRKILKNKDTKLPYPTDDLIREIGLSIAIRKKIHLIQSLLAANLIFRYSNKDTQDIISPFLLEGLEYLILEQSYDFNHNDPETVPLIRLNAVRLAYQMSLKGYKDEPVIQQWLSEGTNDPLPEVRNAPFSKL